MAIDLAKSRKADEIVSQNSDFVCPHCQAKLDKVVRTEVKSVYRDNFYLSCESCKKVIVRS